MSTFTTLTIVVPPVPADVLALFDMDHTLLPQDSDEQWVEFLIAEGELDRAKYEQANHALITRYNRGEAGPIEFTEFYLSTLVGRDEAKLKALRERYLAVRVRPRIVDKARALVDRHRNAGDVTVITTAVSTFLAGAIAAEFGVTDVIATEPEIIDGHYTGRVVGTPNMREGKVERLHGWLAARGKRLADFREVWAYADSQNDLALLSHVTHPVAVNADPVLAVHARHEGWPIVQIN
jgi:HAD superfamily hydrolase (TIGR01490 family)